jgi:hypothetical protein
MQLKTDFADLPEALQYLTTEPAMPDKTVESLAHEAKIGDLILDNLNANQGTERGDALLGQSIQKLGAGRSILLDKNGRVIAGNKTVAKFGEVGLEDVVIVRTDGKKLVAVQRTDLDLDSPEGREMALADNRVSEVNLSWDTEALAEIGQEVDLGDWFTEEEMAGWDVEVDDFDPPSDEQDEETTADLIEQAEAGGIESRVKLGEIWKLGRHRIACGDSTDEGNVRKLLGGKVPGMVWSDAPYGISIVATNGYVGGGDCNRTSIEECAAKRLGSVGGSKPFGSKDVRGTDGASNIVEVNKYAPIIGDDTTDTAINAYKTASTIATKAVHIWWGGNYFASALPDSSCWLVWDKENTGNFADAELAWCNHPSAVRIFRHMWNGMVKASEHGQKRVHPTQKPIALCEWAFEKYGTDTDLIFDPFLGSAPSIIAAQKMPGSRTVYGFELSPDYCEVIIRRWEEFTGGVAELAGVLS